MRRARARGCRAGSATAGRRRSPRPKACSAEIKKSYELYGFEAVETPFIEFTDALGKFLPDLDRPERGRFFVPRR